MKRDANDARWSNMIRERDNWTCQRCGAVFVPPTKALHAAHCFSRGKPSTRLDPANGMALCYGCHRFIDGHPAEREALFRAKLGGAAYEALQLRSNRTKASRTVGVGVDPGQDAAPAPALSLEREE